MVEQAHRFPIHARHEGLVRELRDAEILHGSVIIETCGGPISYVECEFDEDVIRISAFLYESDVAAVISN